MTDILIVWLNTEVDLSKKIKNLEEDFANGFYLGELLYKFNQLTEFHQFKNKDDRDSKINNFKILQKVFSNIKVPFDSIIAKEIMDKKKGAIALLLYKIRTRLEKKGVSMESLSLKKSTHINELYQSKILGNKIEKYDKLNENFFKERLSKMMPAQKEIEMKKILMKYEEFKEKQEKIISEEVNIELNRIKEERKRKIQSQKNQNQMVHAFNQAFEQKGIDNWKKNMIKKKQMEEKDLEFQLKEAEKFEFIVNKAIKESEKEVSNQIQKFEDLLFKLENQEVNENSKQNKISQTSIKVKQSALEKVNTISEKILKNPNSKKERDRRRRKIIVEQSKAQLEIENLRREEQLIGKLFKYSNQEKQLTFETYRVSQSKEVIIKNRLLRNEMYDIKRDMDDRFNEINQEDYLKNHKIKLDVNLNVEEQRFKDLSVALKQHLRSKNTDYCKNLVDMIIDISDEAYNYQQINDKEEIDDRVWREWTNLFINNISVKKEDNNIQNEESVNNVNVNNNSQMNLLQPEDNDNYYENSNLSPHVLNNDISPNYNSQVNDEFNVSLFHAQSNFETGFSNYASRINDKKLDECEILDYIKYKGQWSYDQVPEGNFITINLLELMSDIEDLNKKKEKDKKKPVGGKKEEEEYKEEDQFNLQIPKKVIKNEYFGNLIDILIEARFGEENDLKLKESEHNKYQFIPIKLAIFGQPFSGKNTIAKELSRMFNLEIFDVDTLLQNSINESENQSETYENNVYSQDNDFNKFNKNYPNDKNDLNTTNKYEELQEADNESDNGEAGNEVKRVNKIKQLALQIKDTLRNGGSIPDKLISELIYENISLKFPLKSKEKVISETIARNTHKQELLDNLEHVKEEYSNRPKFLQAKIEEINNELNKIKNANIFGFIISNYPNTYNQAKQLEYLLSGYIPENEKPKSQVEIYKEESDLILDKTPKQIPKKELIQSGLDHVIFIDTNFIECAIRAFGRRKNMKDNKEYHLINNPPPLNRDICENLLKINDNINTESSFVTRCVSYENTLPLLKEFYEPFGFDDSSIETLIRLNGNSKAELIIKEIINIIERLLQIKEKQEEDLINQQTGEGEEENNDEELSLSGAVDELDHQSNFNLQLSKGQYKSKQDIDIDEENMSISKLSKEKTKKQEDRNEEQKRLLLVKRNISFELADLLMKIWFRMYENYLKECKSVFKFIRKQREFISINYNNLSQKFIEFLKRPNKKQIHLLEYQISYNKFLDDYPDLKDDPRVKEEHHQRVDDLADKIFEIIEIRKAEAIEQRRKIMTSTWIENEMEKFYHNLERLYQTEIDKYIGTIQIIKDFYHAIDNRVLCEIPQFNIDIIKEEIDTVPIEKDSISLLNPSQPNQNLNSSQIGITTKDKKVDQNIVSLSQNYNIFNSEDEYPRIEKLYRTAVKVQFQYDEVLFKAEKERQALLLEKELKEKKKPNLKDVKLQNKTIEVEKKEIYPHEEEMKEAIRLEKAKYRCRITLLRNWGIKYIKTLRNNANEIYSKLEDWIILAIKAENEALGQLSFILKKHIEDEQKIKYELELDTFDIKVNMDVVNYIEEPPKLLPAKEIIDHNKFNIQQLTILINELNTYIVNDSYIRTSNFLKIFEKKYITSKTDNDVYYGLPNSIKKLTFHNFYKFVKCFDPDSTDFMNLQHVLTLFCLLNSPVCMEENEESIKNYVENMYKEERKLEKDEFINIPMWFDEYETCPTPQGYEVFNRVEKLKEIIFYINKDDEDMIDINEILDIFSLKILNMIDKKNNGKTYYEILFF